MAVYGTFYIKDNIHPGSNPGLVLIQKVSVLFLPNFICSTHEENLDFPSCEADSSKRSHQEDSVMFERKGCYNPVAGLIKWMVFGESHFSSVR